MNILVLDVNSSYVPQLIGFLVFWGLRERECRHRYTGGRGVHSLSTLLFTSCCIIVRTTVNLPLPHPVPWVDMGPTTEEGLVVRVHVCILNQPSMYKLLTSRFSLFFRTSVHSGLQKESSLYILYD